VPSRFALFFVAAPLLAQAPVPSPADQIAAAVLPLPEVLRAGAGVRGYDAALRPVTLRETTNGMICTGDRPGDDEFDVRCYEKSFRAVIDRGQQLQVPSQPTAGYRMLGPIGGYDFRTRTFTKAIERWQSVHFPYRTAAELGLPEVREGTMPYVMASGTWWSHVMIQHTEPLAVPLEDPTRLGTISFPTSGAAAAQPDFIRGVLYLHSFEYDEAAASFREAQRKDPDFLMAYWGEAMTHTHPVWNEQDLALAREVLGRLAPTRAARAAKARTERERAWLGAVEALYGDGTKQQRDTLYAAAMEQVAAAYPDDESRTFHSLAIMGLNQGVRDVPAYIRAGAIALEVFQRKPDHPGAAHYVIHAFDDPTHAPLGLEAARAYSAIAPAAAHAQHMTTHIFLALGMWPDVISQNVVASGPDRSRWQAGHYTYWLHYGLVQAGRADEAAALLAELRAHQGDQGSLARRAHLAMARAHQVISGERWSDPALGWPVRVDDTWPSARAMDGLARGLSALGRGDRPAAAAMVAEMEKIETGTGLASIPGLLAKQLRAAVARAGGDRAGAERMLREVAAAAAALPAEFGPPEFVKPPLEQLGEWLLEDGRPADAKQVFSEALALMPGRLLSVRGLERATAARDSRGRP